jgi:regulator of protease activity HflC (stomatin/prohibitin superfamily)
MSRVVRSKQPGQAGAVVAVLIVLAIVVVVGGLLLFMKTVSPGYVGIVFDKSTHKVGADAIEPGWFGINPFTQSYQQYPVTIRTYEMVASEGEGAVKTDDSIKVQSTEGQQLNLDVVIQYQVVKAEAGALYTDWGGATIETVEDRVVRQYTRSAVPNIAGTEGWEQIMAGRAALSAEIQKSINADFAARHLKIVSFTIREVHLPEALKTQLDNKIAAQQKAEQQKYGLQQAKVQAEQDVAVATGKANAAKAEAEGEAAAILLRANAQAKANELLNSSLSPSVIEYARINRWDGKAPLVQGGSAAPFVQLPGSTTPAPAGDGH